MSWKKPKSVFGTSGRKVCSLVAGVLQPELMQLLLHVRNLNGG